MTTLRDQQFTPGTQAESVCCSFCNKGTETVGELIDGPAFPGRAPAYICYDCVELCSSIFQHRKMFGVAEKRPDKSITDPAYQELLKEKIDQAFSILTSLERDVIRLRYGLSDGCTHTLDEVACQLGLTPDRVREIEMQVVEKLRSPKP